MIQGLFQYPWIIASIKYMQFSPAQFVTAISREHMDDIHRPEILFL